MSDRYDIIGMDNGGRETSVIERKDPEGDWVKYDDHQAEIQTLKDKIERFEGIILSDHRIVKSIASDIKQNWKNPQALEHEAIENGVIKYWEHLKKQLTPPKEED